MICQNCGGEYDDSKLRCPYCKSENKKVAEYAKKKTLEKIDRDYERQKEKMQKELPNRVVHKGIRITAICILCVIALILFGVIFVLVGKAVLNLGEEKRTESLERQLENYYEKEDYESMGEILNKLDYWSASLSKYKEVNDVYRAYTYDFCEQTKYWREQKESEWGRENPENLGDTLRFCLLYANNILRNTSTWTKDSTIRLNEEILEEYEIKTKEILRSEFRLTEEHIETLKKDELEEEDYEEIIGFILNF